MANNRNSTGTGQRGRKKEVKVNVVATIPGDKSLIPEKPQELTKAASKVWDKLVPQMLKAGVLSPCDGYSIMMYCESVVLFNEAKVQVSKTGGEVIPSKNGFPMRNPWADARNRAAQVMERYDGKLGLHAQGRAGRSVPSAPGANINPFHNLPPKN